MRRVTLFLFIIFSITSLYSQQFHSLDGIEDAQGNTFLIYKFNQFWYDSLFLSIYKFDLQSFSETKIIESYVYFDPIWFDPQWKFAEDYEFFKNDPINFVNIGRTRQGLYDYIYLAKNDTIFSLVNDDNYGEILPIVEISNSNSQNIYYSTQNLVYRSFDGGQTYSEDSIIAFPLISLADYDDKTFFGLDNAMLIKSNSQGLNYEFVDTSKILIDKHFKMSYDINQFHIYRVNKTYGGYSLNVSNNKGNAFTWTKTYQSENPIYVAIDSTQSGVLYLADGRKIYKSINNGYDFVLYKSLPSKLVGIYKKPDSEIIYAASKSMIFKITPDSITIIKSFSFPEDEYSWFPLAVGNKWVYNQYWFDEGWPGPPIVTFVGTKNMEVTKDTTIENKKYFVVENEYISFEVFQPRMFLRVDSVTGLIYRYWQELNGEYIFHNLNPEIGDTIFHPAFQENPFYILEDEQPINYLGIDTYERRYWEYLPCSCYHTLIKGFGLARTFFSEFGGSESTLKGCVINGVLYGDTTFVVDVDDKLNLIPTEYKLEQNYPNPFNPSTKISYQLPVSGNVTLKVFDVLGREVATLVDEYRDAGSYNLEFRIENLELSSGIYFYQLKAGEFVETKKMLLIK